MDRERHKRQYACPACKGLAHGLGQFWLLGTGKNESSHPVAIGINEDLHIGSESWNTLNLIDYDRRRIERKEFAFIGQRDFSRLPVFKIYIRIVWKALANKRGLAGLARSKQCYDRVQSHFMKQCCFQFAVDNSHNFLLKDLNEVALYQNMGANRKWKF